MHLLARDLYSLDEAEEAVNLGQSPGEIVFLSFSDAELNLLASVHAQSGARLPSLRCAPLAQLKHPYSVDLYVENVARRARLVIVRLLGGKDYWPYGVDELASAARRCGVALAIVPGDNHRDARLERASTVARADLERIWSFFQDGGPDNIRSLLGFAATLVGEPSPWRESEPVAAAGRCLEACRQGVGDALRAFLVCYRSAWLAGDIAPVVALADALQERRFSVEAAFVSSLKDEACEDFVTRTLENFRPDVVLNATSFSARSRDGGRVLDRADAPVLQVALATSTREAWAASKRGANGADLAMNVVLPEVDGRIFTRAISFKAHTRRRDESEFVEVRHAAEPSRIEFVADLATNWARLRRKNNAEKQLALVLSDYPARRGRGGYAIGLDAPRSVAAIVEALKSAGHDIGEAPVLHQPAASALRQQRLPPVMAGLVPAIHAGTLRNDAGGKATSRNFPTIALQHDVDARDKRGHDGTPTEAVGIICPNALMRALEDGERCAELPIADYRRLFEDLPAEFIDTARAAWGEPEQDPAFRDRAFRFSCLQTGKLVIALQPDRGARADRRETYHDPDLPPRHSYLAFYLWLRFVREIDALIHLGTHGTLEWLPGKSVMLGPACAPEVALGPTPVVYPFIVNDPGEAAQAKRRIGAVTIGHLTPELIDAGLSGDAAAIERLLDEYANAATLDPRRANLIAAAILDEAERSGLSAECGVKPEDDPAQTLARLDAWLCDVKELRIGDGLHVFGLADGGDAMRAACGRAEMDALLRALEGRFVPPGPSGAPSRGRADVLPTGRNLFCIDPRHVPTRTAYDIGRRAAKEVMIQYAQEHGEWPRSVVLDLWGSATIRTGGEDFAQALALLGVVPVWDHASARVSGFEIEPAAKREFPRVDVTLHISGLFRDMFPTLIALFHDAVQRVAALDEDASFNPLASAARNGENLERIFGAAQGSYGLGVSETIARGEWTTREDLAEAYLDAAGHSYDRRGESAPARRSFEARVGAANALVHVQDMAETDILSGAAFADFEGGFAAANEALGGKAALVHVDATRPCELKLRSLEGEIARIVRGRAANSRWISGQMRHGHRGGAEIAETIDNLFAFASTSGLVRDAQWDLVFAATLGKDEVRDFLVNANPRAAGAILRTFEEAIARGLWRTRRNSAFEAMNAVRERVPLPGPSPIASLAGEEAREKPTVPSPAKRGRDREGESKVATGARIDARA